MRAIGRLRSVTITSAPFSTARKCSDNRSFNSAILTVFMAISSHNWPYRAKSLSVAGLADLESVMTAPSLPTPPTRPTRLTNDGSGRKKQGGRDSNPRPLVLETSALTRLSYRPRELTSLVAGP